MANNLSLPSGQAVAGDTTLLASAVVQIVEVAYGTGGAPQPVAVATPLPVLADGAQGTGASFNPPAGGSGTIGYLSQIMASLITIASALASYSKFAFVNTIAFAQQAVKASAGTLGAVEVTNNSGAAVFCQIFDLLTGSVTPGTTVPIEEFEIANGASGNLPIPSPGIAMATGITIFCSTTEGGATGSAAGVKLGVLYK